MLTPIDIQNKEFAKAIKGYRENEVDGFLDEVTLDYEKLFKENVELKDKISVLSDQVKHYGSIEQTIQKTLVMAQTTAEEVTVNSRTKAENILEDARKRAESILEEVEKDYKKKICIGNEELRKIQSEYERIRKEMMLYKARCKSIIGTQLEMIESDLEEFSFEEKSKFRNLLEKSDETENEEPQIPEIAEIIEKIEMEETLGAEADVDEPKFVKDEDSIEEKKEERILEADIEGV